MKIEIGLAKGKKNYDKREDIAKKEAKRRIERTLKNNWSWGCTGFDGGTEFRVASGGFSLATLKSEKNNINAKNDNFALAAA